MNCHCTPTRLNKMLNQEHEIKSSNDIKHIENMVRIPKGTYIVGTDDIVGYPLDNEGPIQEIYLDSFLIDKTSVTNEQFKEFIDETGYITEAEKIGSSFVFYMLVNENNPGIEVPNLPWWRDVPNAYWKYPFGDDRSIDLLLDHPVVHVTTLDALAYCKWANKRLPTEIEWQVAAAGDSKNTRYPWGNELVMDGKHFCNIWQGDFPKVNTQEDGYLGTAPVNEFYVNEYGIHQMIGNVWELCSNEARIDLDTIKVETLDSQFDTYIENKYQTYATKGGSFLCHSSYCNRYRLAARNGIERRSSSSNVGFRCVKEEVE